MPQPELLRAAVRSLESVGVPYMLTGSLASSYWGEPRATHDIDLVVALGEERLEGLLAAFPPPKFYISEAAARAAIRQARTFNLIDVEGGDKIDFWILSAEPFDQERFRRRLRRPLPSGELVVCTPEDLILAKLCWAKMSGGSERQLGDARGVLAVQGTAVDRAYVTAWAERLGVAEPWRQLAAEVKPPEDASP